ncbi:MAG: hypothetical protein J0H82_26615 [Alphaproteobacteria bacterium]|jgi:hypothetical protein|nr:hypothetical protein [Alphaproteobacteria bacterium]
MSTVMLDQIAKRLDAIRQSLRWALWAHSLWYSGAIDDDLRARVGRSEAQHAVGRAGAILHQGAILSLTRAWDGKKGTGSLPALATQLRLAAKNASVLQLIAAARGDDGRRRFAVDANRLADRIDQETAGEEVKALARLRHEFLAHARFDAPEAAGRWAEVGDERKLLERTVPLVDELYLLVHGSWEVGFGVPLVEEHMTIRALGPLLWAGVRAETDDERNAYLERRYDLKHPHDKGADDRDEH